MDTTSGVKQTDITTGDQILKILHLNIQSVRSKQSELEQIVNQGQYHVVALCEHWLNDSEIETFNLENYEQCTTFCRENLRGGETMLINETQFSMTAISSPIDSTEQTFEHCMFLCILATVYRSPQACISSFLDRLESLLQYMLKCSTNVIISGDFNVDMSVDSANRTKLIDVFSSYNFRYLITEPTRCCNSAGSVIDNIFVNFDTSFHTRVFNTGISDHQAIELCMSFGNPVMENRNSTTVYRPISADNKRYFCSLLQNESWEDVYRAATVDAMFTSFYDLFLHYFNQAFPKKNKIITQKYNKKKWHDHDILKVSDEVKNLYWLKCHCNDDQIAQKYNEKRKEYKIKLAERQKGYYDNKILNSENRSKCVWDIFKNITGKTIKNQTIELENEREVITDPDRVCSMFNVFFSATPEISRHENTMETRIGHTINFNDSFFLNPVTESEVCSIISKTCVKKSAGLDEIPCSLVKEVACFVSGPLTYIINTSFLEGRFPHLLKKSRVVPLHKKGKKNKIENYRPVAVPSALSKIFERAMYDRLLAFLCSKFFFSRAQHGFLQGRSTHTALFSHITSVLSSLDSGNTTLGIYFDLSKAFNLMNHRVLYDKLERAGVRGLGLAWIRSFLADRTQAVQIKGEKDNILNHKYQSDFICTPTGAPQGSLLSPLLFLIFCNDLSANINSDGVSVVQFADDTSVTICHKNEKTAFEMATSTVEKMYNWCAKNLLLLNTDKTTFINFHNRQTDNAQQTTITIQDKAIEHTQSTKFLGLITHENLNWTEHGEYICQKMASANYAIYNVRNAISLESVLSFYYAFVHSRISYGIIFWGTQFNTMNRIFILQKRIIRSICKESYLEHCVPLFRKLKIMTVYSSYLFSLVCFVYKNPDYFRCNVSVGDHSMATRHGDDFVVPRHSTALFERGPYYMGVKVFNKLPHNIKILKPYERFKRTIKSFFNSHPFYSLQEYFDHDRDGAECTYC